MMQNRFLYVFRVFAFCCLLFSKLLSQEITIPTLSDGRVRPLIAYAYLMERQLGWNHSSNGMWHKTLHLLWQIQKKGSHPFFDHPLFVLSPALAHRSGFVGDETAYSYLQLHEIFTIQSPLYESLSQEHSLLLTEFLQTMSALQHFKKLDVMQNGEEKKYIFLREELEKRGVDAVQIQEYVESFYPFTQRLHDSGELFRILPGQKAGEWFPVHSLSIDLFDSVKKAFFPAPNFTKFSTEDFIALQTAYRIWLHGDVEEPTRFLALLQKAHFHANNMFWEVYGESILMQFPWTFAIALLYFISSLIWGIKPYCWMGKALFWVAFLTNTAILLLRSFILKRPPVSNMTETLLFVPAIASSIALIGSKNSKARWLYMAASMIGATLFLLSWWQEPIPLLGNLQPVLNSWVWLSWHVLLVVSSYALFLMASMLGHLFLFSSQREEAGSLLLKVLYTGVVLLIVGTLLGGAWAAESWGRFWDWDPKESWAFISICTYLLCIHAFHRGYIGYWGLAVGAILGFLSISFTWYGVNYLLGVGLHSYGFGRGGVEYYLTFLCAELVWLIYCWTQHKSRVYTHPICQNRR